jgi:uncharacterized membrane protein (DUF2068 family)
MRTPKRPLGLMLLSIVLLILALRAMGWIVINGLVEQQTPSLVDGVARLLVTAVLLVSATGLLRLQEWARWLTLAVCSIYFGLTLVNVGTLWPSLQINRLNLSLGVLNAVTAISMLALMWWYLNREDVRRLFRKPE